MTQPKTKLFMLKGKKLLYTFGAEPSVNIMQGKARVIWSVSNDYLKKAGYYVVEVEIKEKKK